MGGEVGVLLGAAEAVRVRDLLAERVRVSSGRPASSGVSNRPGAIVITRMPDEARSRAAGSVMPTIPPLDAE